MGALLPSGRDFRWPSDDRLPTTVFVIRSAAEGSAVRSRGNDPRSSQNVQLKNESVIPTGAKPSGGTGCSTGNGRPAALARGWLERGTRPYEAAI